MKPPLSAQLPILTDHYHHKESTPLITARLWVKKKRKIRSESKRLSGKVNLKLNFISTCQQLVTLLKLVWLSSSNLFRMLPKPDNFSQLSEIMKISNADFLSTPQTNMLFLLTLTKEMTHIIVFSPRELLKEFGSFVLMLMLVENQFQKQQNGTINLKKPTLNLVKMVKEF